MTPVSHGKPCAGNPHARFEEGASAPETPRRNALLHKARYVQRGESIDYIPEADVAAGDIIKVGSLVGVAKLDIKAGELGALALVGVYEIATGGAAVVMGDVVSVDPATGKVVAAGTSGAVKFGHAVTAATASDATVNVRLEQGLA